MIVADISLGARLPPMGRHASNKSSSVRPAANTSFRDGFFPMITLRLTTWVNAPVERCFLLATHAELASTQTRVSRSTGGMLQPGDAISWQLGFSGTRHTYASRVETVRPYTYFREVMVAGIFRHFEHDHHFARMDDGTRIRHEIRFCTRFGPAGRMLGGTILRVSLMKMLVAETTRLKRMAESEEWRRYVGAEVGANGEIHEAIKVAEPVARVANMQRFA